MFSMFDNDPFFNMDGSFHSNFQGLFNPALPEAVGVNSQHMAGGNRAMDRHNSNNRQLSHFDDIFSHDRMMSGFGGGMFQRMNAMMSEMQNSMQQMQRNPPPGAQVYSSSNFYSYDSRGGQGEPHVYQAQHNVRMADGLKEERKAVRDSRKHEEKVHVARYLNDKGHVVERRRNLQNNDEEENRESIGLENEQEEGEFHNEWTRQANEKFASFSQDRRRYVSGTDRNRALPESRRQRTKHGRH